MLRVALRPKFLGLLAVMILATVICALLASWQWDRAHQAISSRSAEAQDLGNLTDLMAVGDPVTNDMVGGIVTATGTYDPQEQVVVPGRVIEETDAVVVVSALHVTTSDGTVSRIPVARGWLPASAVVGPSGSVGSGSMESAAIPAPPSGEVTVRGMLEASEAASSGVVDGVAMEIATPLLVNEWGGPMYAGYIAIDADQDGLRAMPESGSAFTAGLDWQNLGYALQWVLFGGFFLYLWWRSVRTAYLDEQEIAREEALATMGEGAARHEVTTDLTTDAAPTTTSDAAPEGRHDAR